MKQKTIFIVISQAMLIRNILRSGTLEELKKVGHRIIILISCNEVPQYLKDEFEDEQVTVLPIPLKALSVTRWHRRFILLTHFLNLNDTTRVYFRYSRHYINRSPFKLFLYWCALQFFSRVPGLKKLMRWIEARFFPEHNDTVKQYFDTYPVDLVFSTSITSKVDNIFMKEARRRGVKAVSMTKSWDNATKMYFRFVPDHFLVQNDTIRTELARLQDFPIEEITVVGFPQFDWYRRDGVIKTREEHLRSKGLDPNLPTIFFGSQGIWYKNDFEVAEHIQKWIANDELAKKCQLIVRPHFTNVKDTKLKALKGLPGVAYDDSYDISNLFSDNWDPKVPEIVDFANTMKHSDVIVNMLSTISLDAACFDRPTINVLFGGTFQRGRDVTAKIAKVVHYQWVFDTGATISTHSYDELKKAINKCLLDPKYKSKEREDLIDQMCYKVDGKSSLRVADCINTFLT